MYEINILDSYPVKQYKRIENRIEEIAMEIAHLYKRFIKTENHLISLLPDISVIAEMMELGRPIDLDTPETLKLEKRMEILNARIDILWNEYRIWKPNANFRDVTKGVIL